MDLNLISIVYLIFRLAPFIIVCFFTLNSIINQDLRGVMYLSGLLILIFFVFISPKLWILIIANVFLLINLGLIVPLDIFRPFIWVYNKLKMIWHRILVLLATSVLALLVLGSYLLHVYEFSEIDRINKKVGETEEDNCGPWYSLNSNICRLKKLIGIISNGFEESKDESDGYCMDFSVNGTEIKKPLAASIYGYTYAYLMYFIHKYDLVQHNLPVVILFPLFALGDLGFQKFHHCKPSLGTNVLALVLGLCWGTNWGDVIARTKNASLQYFVGSDQPVCSVPTSQNFVCNVYKNGQLIATQTNGSSKKKKSE